jgi:Zn finger protein HypA/HybF involved in hydrogenase expression
MPSCKHEVLTLVPMKSNRLRCRHCHLTISEDELGNGDCPECLEVHKIKRRDFEHMNEPESSATRYYCERCGAVVDFSLHDK